MLSCVYAIPQIKTLRIYLLSTKVLTIYLKQQAFNERHPCRSQGEISQSKTLISTQGSCISHFRSRELPGENASDLKGQGI